MTTELSRREARSIAITAQGLGKVVVSSGSQVLERLGCIQIDAMRPIRRSHELALLARGVVSDKENNFLPPGSAFETWGHAHSLLPMSLWPYLGFRRREIAHHGLNGPGHSPEVAAQILQSITSKGPQTLAQLDRAEGVGWNRTSPSRSTCEWLLSVGQLACTKRDGRWQRIYSLPQDEIPINLLNLELSDEDCLDEIVKRSLAALGVATVDDISDYFRVHKRRVIAAIERNSYEEFSVEGSEAKWYIDSSLSMHKPELEQTIALSPLDNLIWTRSRQTTLFGKNYLLEAYKPAIKRQFGYYALPILHHDALVGRIAARMKSTTLIVEAFELDPGVDPEIRQLIYSQLVAWTGAQQIMEQVK